jgi:methylisocitrate lyase
MKDRIKAAVDAREDESFVIMARSDALAVENEKMLYQRLESYIEAGADMIFPEALTKLSQYKYISKNFSSPLLANITEFGKTPLFTKNELKNVGVSMILYPLSAFRAMSSSAERVYSEIIKEGSQKKIINQMQTRNELYDYLSYYDYENEIDKIVKNKYGL